MPRRDCIRELQDFINERWSVAGPRYYPDVAEAPQVPPVLSTTEACWFMACVRASAGEPAMLVVDDCRKMRSDRVPLKADGRARGYNFFEHPGRLRLETLVHWAAMARLRDEFGWPREHLICESPRFVRSGETALRQDALDIVLLAEPCPEPLPRMPLETTARVAVEAKATAGMLDKLIQGMRLCQTANGPHRKTDHVKCSAIAVLRPQLFLGVAAGPTWRLFRVVQRGGGAVLGDELPTDGGDLDF